MLYIVLLSDLWCKPSDSMSLALCQCPPPERPCNCISLWHTPNVIGGVPFCEHSPAGRSSQQGCQSGTMRWKNCTKRKLSSKSSLNWSTWARWPPNSSHIPNASSLTEHIFFDCSGYIFGERAISLSVGLAQKMSLDIKTDLSTYHDFASSEKRYELPQIFTQEGVCSWM